MEQKKKTVSERIKRTAKRAQKRCSAWWYRRLPNKWERSPEQIEIMTGLMLRAETFVGLYEPVYQVSRGAVEFRKSVFGEWCLRVENLQLDDGFSREFLALFSNAEEWDKKDTVQRAAFLLSCFEGMDILRDTRRAITADDDTSNWYSSLDGEDILPGDQLKVKKPCWRQGNTLMERGLVLKSAGEQQ